MNSEGYVDTFPISAQECHARTIFTHINSTCSSPGLGTNLQTFLSLHKQLEILSTAYSRQYICLKTVIIYNMFSAEFSKTPITVYTTMHCAHTHTGVANTRLPVKSQHQRSITESQTFAFCFQVLFNFIHKNWMWKYTFLAQRWHFTDIHSQWFENEVLTVNRNFMVPNVLLMHKLKGFILVTGMFTLLHFILLTHTYGRYGLALHFSEYYAFRFYFYHHKLYVTQNIYNIKGWSP
jgi:hypothetical protein